MKKAVKPSAVGAARGSGGASRSVKWRDKVFFTDTPVLVRSERERAWAEAMRNLEHWQPPRPIYIEPLAFPGDSLPTHLFPTERLIAFGDCIFSPGEGEQQLCFKWPVEIGWREKP